MPPPHPPAGNQQQHTERPLKVYAEQYLAAAPLPIGAVLIPDLFTDGLPRVFTDTKTYELHETEWVIANRYTGKPIEVISDEEKQERFGGTADADES
jgi:hypothetical protein